MKASEYFGDWMDVIDTVELRKILSWISIIDKTTLCPSSPNIFKAFRACPLKDCKVVFLGQDPYPQQGVATGILFGNSKDTPEDKLSPSLQVVKEAAINYEIPHNRIDFDNTLESWAAEEGRSYITWSYAVNEIYSPLIKELTQRGFRVECFEKNYPSYISIHW